MKKKWFPLLLALIVIAAAVMFLSKQNNIVPLPDDGAQEQTVLPVIDDEDAQPSDTDTPDETHDDSPEAVIDENGSYDSKEDVALYIHTYGHLPPNYVTKKEAESKGWSGGSLEQYFPGCCIGGSRFGNYEGLLPEKNGRSYTECDIDTMGAKSRGAKRIVFSNDGLIFYTDDHYESFELLYGEVDG